MPLRRTALVAGIALALVAAIFGITRIKPSVEVTTGTRVVCKYNHPISENIKKIKVPADQASLYRVKTVTRTCAKHRQAEELYAQAQSALAEGDTKKAKTKLTEVIALDSSFESAAQQLETIERGKKPSADTTENPPSKSPKPAEEPGGGGATALTEWVPSALKGYSAQAPLVEAMAVTRQYFPSSSNDVVQLVIVAEQYKTPTGAKRALGTEVKAKYTSDEAALTAGSHAAYYGTDGSRFAVIGFTQGAVMIAVEIGAKPGVDPDRLKGALVEIVEQLP